MNIQKWKNAHPLLRGVDHVENNVPCQDYVHTKRSNGVIAIALADGAGSRKHSDIGAQLVTKKVCELLTSNFQYYLQISENQSSTSSKEAYQDLRDVLYKSLYNEVSEYAYQNSDLTVKDLASTLLFFAFKNDRYIMGHVGDGVIAGLQSGMRNDYLETLSHPDNGDQPNVTFFLTESNGKENLRLYQGKVGNLKGVLLMSDGPEDVFYDKNEGLHVNTLKVFNNFYSVDEEEYENILTDLLKKNVATYSFDDLSMNLIYLEQTSLKNMTDDYMQTVFKNVQSKKQIIQRSRSTLYIDDSLDKMKPDFDTIDELRKYLETL